MPPTGPLERTIIKLESEIVELRADVQALVSLLGTQNDAHSIFLRVYSLEQWRTNVETKFTEQKETLATWMKLGFSLFGTIVGALVAHFIK